MPPRASRKLHDRFRSSHWGIEANQVWEVDDPDLPVELVEMGKLKELGWEGSNLGLPADFFQFSAKASLTFCPATERLYCLLTPRDQEALYQEFWIPHSHGRLDLPALAHEAGGSQNGHPYPRIRVLPIGPATYIIYGTHKKGDGPSLYEHEFGEESGLLPWLAVDAQGRLWFAGGNYTVPDGGITD